MKLPVYALIDLSSGKAERFEIDEKLYRNYIGGKTLGARLLYDLTPAGLDPLSPEAVVIINTSPANGTGAPSSSRFNMTFKNVLTGGIASSNCGGQFGVMMKRAGYDGIIIKGAGKTPCTVSIIDGRITISDAGELWGKDAEETQEAFRKSTANSSSAPPANTLSVSRPPSPASVSRGDAARAPCSAQKRSRRSWLTARNVRKSTTAKGLTNT